MQIAGIIAEYNPFHSGHAWQIDTLKKQGYDAVVVVMSPSVCQRGSVSFLPYSVRAKAALMNGADLVLTLPAPYAIASAEQFAAAGVHLLTSLGCVNTLAFGAETPNTELLMKTAQNLLSTEFSQVLQPILKTGVSYASARSKAMQILHGDTQNLLNSPNNILGVEYCKAIINQKSNIKPLALVRKGVNHDEQETQGGFASASTLREMASAEMGNLSNFVPNNCVELYKEAQEQGLVLCKDKFDIAVLSRLRGKEPQDFINIRGVNEGLENKLFKAVQTAQNTQQLYDLLKSKRYAHSRMRRLVLDTCLQIPKDIPFLPTFIHVKGVTQNGLKILKLAKQSAKLPLNSSLKELESLGKEHKKIVKLHSFAEDFALLCRKNILSCGSAYTEKTIFLYTVL